MTFDELLDALGEADCPQSMLDYEIANHVFPDDRWQKTAPRPYTASLDAAMMLIPPGWMVTKIFQFREFDTAAPFGWGCQLNIEGDEDRAYFWSAQSDVPAIAVCLAALQARRSMKLTGSLAPKTPKDGNG